MRTHKITTREEVFSVLYGSTASMALGAAVETGLLWMLAEAPLSAQEIVRRLGIPGKRGYYWLQLLEALGILDCGPEGYFPSAVVSEALLPSHTKASWMHLAVDERERVGGVKNLALFLQTPGSAWEAQVFVKPRDYVEKMRDDPMRAREFTRMLHELHQNLANELAACLDLADPRRVIDVGGGSGVVSLALLRKYPGLSAVVADIENVCIAGREIAEENSLAKRMTYIPMDIAIDDFPGRYDLALLCDVGVFGEALYRRLWACLNPGGRLVIVFHFAPGENAAPTSRLEWTFTDSLADPDFSIPTIARTEDDLARAGFHLLPGYSTLLDKRILVQAQKPS